MDEDAIFTGQYAAQLDTNILLPDLAYSNAATLSFCDSVRLPLCHQAFAIKQMLDGLLSE